MSRIFFTSDPAPYHRRARWMRPQPSRCVGDHVTGLAVHDADLTSDEGAVARIADHHRSRRGRSRGAGIQSSSLTTSFARWVTSLCRRRRGCDEVYRDISACSGRKRFVVGNHDPCTRRTVCATGRKREVFETIDPWTSDQDWRT